MHVNWRVHRIAAWLSFGLLVSCLAGDLEQGWTEMGLRRPDLARMHFASALDAQPDSPEAHLGMALAEFWNLLEGPNAFTEMVNRFRTPETAGLPTLRVNFQPDAVAPTAFLADTGLPYSEANGYGWDNDRTANMFRRNLVPDELFDTGAFFAGGETAHWWAKMRPGNYEVMVSVGDPAALLDEQAIMIHAADADSEAAGLAENVQSENTFAETGKPQGWHADKGMWPYELPFTVPFPVELPFPSEFPFFGGTYDSVEIHADGYLTFLSHLTESIGPVDPGDTELLRFTTMVSPFGSDLRTDVGACDIFIDEVNDDRVTIRWKAVTKVGSIPVNFAVDLNRDGQIRFRYGECGAATGLVGVSSGTGSDRYVVSAKNGQLISSAADSLFVPALLTWAGMFSYYKESFVSPEFIGGGIAKGWQSQDNDSWQLVLPWEFEFFGVKYSECRVAVDGFVQFGDGPLTDFRTNDDWATFWENPLIAVVGWPASTLGQGNDIFVHQPDPDHLVVRWHSQLLAAEEANFELVLGRAGTIRMNYGRIPADPDAWIGVSAGEDARGILSIKGDHVLDRSASVVYEALEAGDQSWHRRVVSTYDGMISITVGGHAGPTAVNSVIIRPRDNAAVWPRFFPDGAPPISEVVSVLDSYVVPVLNRIIGHLDAVQQHPDYSRYLLWTDAYDFWGQWTQVEVKLMELLLVLVRGGISSMGAYNLDHDYDIHELDQFDLQAYLDANPELFTRYPGTDQRLESSLADIRLTVDALQTLFDLLSAGSGGVIGQGFDGSAWRDVEIYFERWVDLIRQSLDGPVDFPVNILNTDDGVFERIDLGRVFGPAASAREDLPDFYVANPADAEWQNRIVEMSFPDATLNMALPVMNNGELTGILAREAGPYFDRLIHAFDDAAGIITRFDFGVGLLLAMPEPVGDGVQLSWQIHPAYNEAELLAGFERYEIYRSVVSPCDRNRPNAEWQNGLTLVGTVSEQAADTFVDTVPLVGGKKHFYRVYAVTDTGVIIRSDQRFYATEDYVGEAWHVDDSNATGQEDGSSIYPFSTIREAVFSAANRDLIKVAEGVYREEVSVWDKDLDIRGGYEGAATYGRGPGDFSEDNRVVDRTANITAIDGEGDRRGVVYAVLLGPETPGRLSGFLIQNGSGGERGGGIWCHSYAEPTITDCTVVGCVSDRAGGGVLVELEAAPTFERCEFRNNTAPVGGGVCVLTDSGVELADCSFLGNPGGAGSGFAAFAAQPCELSTCLFDGNGGDPVYLQGCASPLLVGDEIHDSPGAGIVLATCTEARVVNCSIYDIGLTGIYQTAGQSALIGNTIAFTGGVGIEFRGTVSIRSNIIVASGDGAAGVWARDGGGGMDSDYNCFHLIAGAAVGRVGSNTRNTLADWQGVTGQDMHSLSADPLFVDAGGRNFRLQTGSACVDAGWGNTLLPNTDIMGLPRIDNPNVPNTGGGTPVYHDIGANELVELFRLDLFQGWNLVSFPILPEPSAAAELLVSTGLRNLLFAGHPYAWDARGGFYRAVADFEPSQGYWIYCPDTPDAPLTVPGWSTASNPEWAQGWNCSGVEMAVAPGNPRQALIWDAEIQQFRNAPPGDLQPGTAYWLLYLD